MSLYENDFLQSQKGMDTFSFIIEKKVSQYFPCCLISSLALFFLFEECLMKWGNREQKMSGKININFFPGSKCLIISQPRNIFSISPFPFLCFFLILAKCTAKTFLIF
jgi:hypothetical protein